MAFDLRVHIKEPKTGKVIQTQPYKLHVDREKGRLFERPAGYFYTEDGVLVKSPEMAAEKKEPVQTTQKKA